MKRAQLFNRLLTLTLVLGMTIFLSGQPAMVEGQAGNPNAYGSDASAPNNVVFVSSGGYVGIGNPAPTPMNRLHVVAAGAAEAALFESADNRAYAGIRLRPGGTTQDESANDVVLSTKPDGGFLIQTYNSAGQGQEAFTVLRDGYVGIGTTAPTNRLHVVAAGAASAARFETAGLYGAISLRQADGDPSRVELAAGPNGFEILTYGNPSGIRAFTVSRNGSVGIGTTAPSEELEVVGNLRMTNGPGGPGDLLLHNPSLGYSGVALSGTTGDTLVINPVKTFAGGVRIDSSVAIQDMMSANVVQITGGDLAEPFEMADEDTIEPGMVVAIDPDNPGQMRLAKAAYDRTVAGVVSGAGGIAPGVLMYKDGAGEDTHPVALSGRVYVYADAANGPIQPGDLLTTSDTPGHAMKVTDYERAQGAILGKAMSKLDEGTGLVLVLVTLQ